MIQSPVRHRRPAACAAAGLLTMLCAPLFTTVRGQEESKLENKSGPPPAASDAANQSFRGIKLVADRMEKNGHTVSGFIGDEKAFQVTELPAPAQAGSDAEKVAITAWSTNAAEAAALANAVRASYDKRIGQPVLDAPPATDTAPGPLDALRAVAAKLREKGQAAEADAIVAELKKLSAPSATVEAKAPAKPAPPAPATELQELRAEMAEVKVALTALQQRPAGDGISNGLLEAKLDLQGAIAAGLGARHPKVLSLKQAISTMQNLENARAAARLEVEFKANTRMDPRRAEAVKPTDQAGNDLPWGVAVRGKKGMVYTPYSPEPDLVSVEGFKTGDKVKCPHTGNFFRVP